MKSCLLKLTVCLLTLCYCLYSSENQITFDVVAISMLSCRYFAIFCVECLYTKLEKKDILAV
ncbi:hypothetical protein [Candidatus Uabimicrobium sp. HlEnr_7]|uniref:hypothetical protein n=1 Tax=Candidatus Uabimicrobium helgolandensis TaxID=3095367 RepID=UPI0035570EB5